MRHLVLILGGTTEARVLAQRLAARPELSVTLSLAGRTRAPAAQPVPVRVGGFGGAEGLAAYLRENRVALLIDATHPYAARISRNAAEAARLTATPILALRRPPWTRVEGDLWREVDTVAEAVVALGAEPRRVFLALGRQEARAFEAAPQHRYLVRSVDPIAPPLALPHVRTITARGPFDETAERALLAAERIELVVAKNSGGAATYGKIAAARGLGIEVVLVRRPELPQVVSAGTVDEAAAMAVGMPGA